MSTAAFRFPALHAQDPADLGDFRLVARLGEGGMGQVFLALSPGGQPAAVKMIRPEFARDPEFGQRFEREVRAAQRVLGAHLAPLLDADPRGEQPWLATAFVAGPTLRDLVTSQGPLPAPQVLLLAWGIAHALTDIHTARVVHRDLKPGNIMLDETGPKVIDFGIVKSMTQSVTYSSHSTRIGTPLYMSPEQAMGRAVGAPSDVFALGSTLYYLATGREAFGAENEWGVAHRIVADDPDLSSVTAGRLRELISACLAKQPGDRPTAPGVLARCEEELGDVHGPGAWMRIDGARTAIQERTGALRDLAPRDDPDAVVTTPLGPPVQRAADLPKTRPAEPPSPVPPRRGTGKLGAVVAVHLIKLMLATAALIWATSLPIMTETWTSDSTGRQVAQVTESFDWHHPWAPYSSGLSDVHTDWMAVPIGVFGTLALIVCAAVYLLRLSPDPDYQTWARTAAAIAGIWTLFWSLVAACLIVMTLGMTFNDDNPAYNVRSVLEPGGWLLLLANFLAVQALLHVMSRRGDAPTAAA
ncbi:serine/threonine-protein kinase [Streptomyces lydicus]|uniref:serine/threonine-protein kinase n=1 Tax=Streptomyces lydicus TaxID=47763 RepID=UPI00371A6ABC